MGEHADPDLGPCSPGLLRRGLLRHGAGRGDRDESGERRRAEPPPRRTRAGAQLLSPADPSASAASSDAASPRVSAPFTQVPLSSSPVA